MISLIVVEIVILDMFLTEPRALEDLLTPSGEFPLDGWEVLANLEEKWTISEYFSDSRRIEIC